MNYIVGLVVKKKNHVLLKDSLTVLSVLLLSGIACFLFQYLWIANTSIYHTVMELICIFISLAAFFVFWYSYDLNDLVTKNIMAFGFLAVAIFNSLHLISYPEINLVEFGGGELCARFWLLGRLTDALVLLFSAIKTRQVIKARYKELVMTLIISSILSSAMIVFDKYLPKLYTPIFGVTSAKIILDYVVVFIYMAAFFAILKKTDEKNPIGYRYLLIGIVYAICSQLCFTLYSNQYSFFVFYGHVLKCIFYLYLYRGIFVCSVMLPYEEKISFMNDSIERFKCAFDNIGIGVALTDLDGTILRANGCLERLLGYPENGLTGVKFIEIIPKEDSFINEMHMMDLFKKNRESILYYEGRYIHKDGTDVWVKVNITMIEAVAGNPSYFIYEVSDMSNSKKIIELETGMKKKAEQLMLAIEHDKLKTEFFANLSHELRTPLNVISGATQLLEMELDNSKEERMKKNLYYIKQNSRRLLRLVNNLIDTTKLDAGFFQMNLKNYNIVKLVEDITLSICGYTNMKGLELTFDTETEEKIIACDPDKIERIMLNLLSNSIKFTEQGGSIRVEIKDLNDSIRIEVNDTGIGIPEDKLETIFDRFSQVNKSFVKHAEGSGIGLSLVKALVELHGGSISVDSIVGVGTEFYISLPAKTTGNDMESGFESHSNDIIERVNVEFSDIYFNI